MLVVYFAQDSVAFNYKGKSSAYHHPNSSYKDYYFPDQLNMTYKNLTIMSPVDSLSKKAGYDQLYGWFVYHEGIADKIPTIVYFHENDYFPPARLYMIEKLYKNPQKYNVVMVDYRGYGYSQGKPSEDGLYSDCRAIMDFVLRMQEIDQKQVYIFGASLGGVMATYSALHYQDRVNALILQNTIASVRSIINDKAPILDPIVPLVLKLKMRSDERIKEIHLPIMFIVGLNDTSTGPHQMEIMYNSAVNAKERDLYNIPGCDHYLTWYYGGKEFDTRLTDFISRNNPEAFGLYKVAQEVGKSFSTFGLSVKNWLLSQF